MWVDPVKFIPSSTVGTAIKGHQNHKNKWFVNLCDDANKRRSKSENVSEENLINYRNWSTPSKSNKKLNSPLLMITWIELCVNIFLSFNVGFTVGHELPSFFMLLSSIHFISKGLNCEIEQDQTRDRDLRDKIKNPSINLSRIDTKRRWRRVWF